MKVALNIQCRPTPTLYVSLAVSVPTPAAVLQDIPGETLTDEENTVLAD